MNITYFPLIILAGLAIYYLRAPETRKSRLWNVLLSANLLLFFSPLIYAFIDSLPDGNMWSDIGSGAILWSYFLLFPLCLLIFGVLLAVRSRFKSRGNV